MSIVAGYGVKADGTESGETMKVAGLKAIDTVVESSAVPNSVSSSNKQRPREAHQVEDKGLYR